MRIGTKSKVYFLLFFFSFSLLASNTINSQSPPVPDTVLETRILEISLNRSNNGTGFSEYIFAVIGEVWNKNDNSVSIEHRDTCGFGVQINPMKIPDGVTVYSSIGCGDAITTITYSPGTTNYSVIGAITVQSSTSTSLPDGFYEITLGDPSRGVYDETVTFVKTSMTVSEGEITFNYSVTDLEWGNTYSSSIYDLDPVSTTVTSSEATFTPTETSLVSETISSAPSDLQKENDKPDVVSETLNFNFGTFLISILLLTGFRLFIKRSTRL